MTDGEFQSTRPRGARHRRRTIVTAFNLCFNPRAREGRDLFGFPSGGAWFVSIHAPARGATAAFLPFSLCKKCFNPRAREGRDRQWHKVCQRDWGFNPRAREGRDTRRAQFEITGFVSIHAPARGATLQFFAHRCKRVLFQSTRPRGARQKICSPVTLKLTVSIHAPARGATPAPTVAWHALSFNPRAREGRDPASERRKVFVAVSIHAPARGATTPASSSDPNTWFQSTRPRGARLRRWTREEAAQNVSIHAPARGATVMTA